MNILITGSDGFIGKNLIAELKNRGYNNIFEYDKKTDSRFLDEYCKNANFVFHLAGVNRTNDESDFMKGNLAFTSNLINKLIKKKNSCPVMISSSVQAAENSMYGKSKKAGEDFLFKTSIDTGRKVLVYRFPNVFGKWSKPNYNSVVATFCYNIANDLPIKINNPNTILQLVYIDDVINELIRALEGNENQISKYCDVASKYNSTLGEISDLIYSFRSSRKNLSIPDMSNVFIKKLYSTYLSYLTEDKFSYDLFMINDIRGSFTEFIRTADRGQISVNIIRPGITKGNHWHHSKNEKFLVVRGKGVIRFRKINTETVLKYYVTGEKLQVVDIPVGYTHNIENLVNDDLIVIMWVNEPFNEQEPDTYIMEV